MSQLTPVFFVASQLCASIKRCPTRRELFCSGLGSSSSMAQNQLRLDDADFLALPRS
jgi:hypothetical protein